MRSLVGKPLRYGRFRRPELKGEGGAMLIEALVAITVFTLLGAAVLAGMSTTQRTAFSVEQSATAENVARNEIESVLVTPYGDLEIPSESTDTVDSFTVTTSIEDFDSEDELEVALIVVKVDRGGETVYTLQSLKTEGVSE